MDKKSPQKFSTIAILNNSFIGITAKSNVSLGVLNIDFLKNSSNNFYGEEISVE